MQTCDRGGRDKYAIKTRLSLFVTKYSCLCGLNKFPEKKFVQFIRQWLTPWENQRFCGWGRSSITNNRFLQRKITYILETIWIKLTSSTCFLINPYSSILLRTTFSPMFEPTFLVNQFWFSFGSFGKATIQYSAQMDFLWADKIGSNP